MNKITLPTSEPNQLFIKHIHSKLCHWLPTCTHELVPHRCIVSLLLLSGDCGNSV